MRNSHHLRPCLIAGAVVALCGAGHAAAQSAPPATAATLDEVVVTAQRREERLVDVPISVVTKSAEQLQASGVRSMTDIAKLVPAVSVTRLGAYSQPAIRGVSTKANSPGLDANVATYVDGFYQSNPMAINRSLADIENIQVLRGPQGALYGRNATGGAFIITTRTPTHTPTLNLSGEVERYSGHTINGFGSIGLTDNLAVSYTTHWGESDGWLRLIGPGAVNVPAAPRKTRNNRLRLLFEPTDKLNFLVTLEEGFNKDGTSLGFSYYAHPGTPGVSPLLTDPRNLTSYANVPQIVSALWRGAYLTANADLGFATLTSYSQYRKDRGIWRFDTDGSNVFTNVGSNARIRMPQRTMSQEFTLASKGDGPLTWLAGASYLNDHTAQEFYFLTFIHPRIETKALAAYADATYAVSDQLFLTVGGRYTQEKKHCSLGANSTGPYGDCPGGDPNRTDDGFTPRAVVRYEFDPNTSVYGSYTKGFKSGGYNTGSAAGQLRPEKISSFEVGAKTVRGPISAEVAAF
ncbi:MAG: hypothetical protein JWO33_2083, partial [Caulobacteraceae bacterium]|nr:hypothetical protein [Caulobacteraceae bacterium]